VTKTGLRTLPRIESPAAYGGKGGGGIHWRHEGKKEGSAAPHGSFRLLAKFGGGGGEGKGEGKREHWGKKKKKGAG